MMNEKSFWDEYNEILMNSDRWCYYRDMHNSINAQSLFNGNNAIEFIKSVFSHGGKGNAIHLPHGEQFEMTEERANHALSAFLFGVLLRDGLKINMQELPKLHKEPTKNFLYFWSLTCLYHDFTTTLEAKSRLDRNGNETDCSRRYITELATMKKFCSYFDIKYSLIADSEDGTLIENYYNYRVQKYHAIDHGIASGMLLYDQLMKAYQNASKLAEAKRGTTFTLNNLKYSTEYPKHILLIANTIAKHNMWRADADKVTVYQEYNLDDLIPNTGNTHIVSFDSKTRNAKDKLLFLLGLVDTLEPVKCIGRCTNENPNHNPYIVLEKIKIELDPKMKAVTIKCPQNYFYDYKNSTAGITNWMDLSTSIDEKNHSITFSFNRKSENTIVAA